MQCPLLTHTSIVMINGLRRWTFVTSAAGFVCTPQEVHELAAKHLFQVLIIFDEVHHFVLARASVMLLWAQATKSWQFISHPICNPLLARVWFMFSLSLLQRYLLMRMKYGRLILIERQEFIIFWRWRRAWYRNLPDNYGVLCNSVICMLCIIIILLQIFAGQPQVKLNSLHDRNQSGRGSQVNGISRHIRIKYHYIRQLNIMRTDIITKPWYR